MRPDADKEGVGQARRKVDVVALELAAKHFNGPSFVRPVAASIIPLNDTSLCLSC
jgi:hypothetical protein